MDDRSAIVLFVLEWVWLPIGATLLWSIRKILGLEKSHGMMRTDIAVIRTSQGALKDRLKEVDERNITDHTKIEKKLDAHHTSMANRLDSLITITRNGNGNGKK